MAFPQDPTMEPVVQKHPEGCALACAAILSRLSYDETARIAAGIGIHAGDKALCNGTANLRRLPLYSGAP